MSVNRLSSEARAVLERCDMVANPHDDPEKVSVHDSLGPWLFNVSVGIDGADLMSLLIHATRMRNEGIQIGKAGMQASLRELIGAAEAKESA